ncbi:hypothetical protein [Anaeromyxobacter diazotrophicus]|uniref:Glycosyltransferase RgtA/B/C/D-like domain-containing protein n=1 Tax=Anaeromyxobacter diazotrophicus TaxID=2590199 RepID=A0A7I9VKP5_9BACT|nr:hypothetical protein [Anaeromyxobacter diazotrophicus]GEJ56955.1 hypothetical protein AMYX_16960 [Anaeromyxobacter diazotrophicus]
MAFLRAHRLELGLFAGSLLVLGLFSLGHHRPSHAPHFMYQADAWLHGQLQLRLAPPDLNDWARERGRWYVSFPPGPALLMLPLVALWGVALDDVTFTLLFAALNVPLFFLVLERLRRAGDSARTRREDAALALLFAFGTVAFSCSIRGEVWFTAEVLGVTATYLYLLAAHRAAHPLLAGIAWSFGAITRTPLVFTVAFFAAEVLAGGGPLGQALRRGATWRDPARWRKAALFAAGAAPLLLFAAWANWERFGSPLDFGHAHLWNNRVNADIRRWGLFSLHYLPKQLHAAFTRLPRLEGGRLGYHPDGMSLLLTTPLFLLLWPRARARLTPALAFAAAAAALPGLLYQNTGYVQFGYRFSLDYTPYLFLLLAVGGRPMGRAFWALGLFGVAVNTWGALAFAGGVS